jgi:hypothetical protein
MLAAVLLGSLTARAAEPASQPATQPTPVAAVWTEVGYPPPGVTEYRRLIVGVWSDGTVVTSDNRQRGGKPYRSFKTDAKQVRHLLAGLSAIDFFTDDRLAKEPPRPPDAGLTAVAATDGERSRRLALWRAPTTRPAEADHYLERFVEARKRIEQFAGGTGEPVEKIDERVFRLGR